MAGASPAKPSLGAFTRRRIRRLMAARLGLAVGAFGLAVAFVGVGREGAELAEQGLYATLTAAFAATLLYASLLRFARRLKLFGGLQIVTDVAIVTSLVTWSGGADSIFSFLLLPITLYGAMLFGRRGAYGSAVLASGGYALALVAAEHWGLRAALGGVSPSAPLFALWVVHTAALLLVALLSSALARELRLAGAALEESATDLDRLRRLHERTVESLTSGLLTTDPDGSVTSFNPEAERITGRPEAGVLGKDIEKVLPGARSLVMDREGREGRIRARMTLLRADRSTCHVGLTGSILREADGTPSGHVIIFQDVSDVVAMEQDLRRSERLAAAGQLAADMAHEIRNPLAAISGSIEMLRSGLGRGPEDAERRRLMDIVLREVDRLDRLIGDFLGYARPAPPRPVPVELAPVLDELLGMFATSPAAEQVEIQQELSAGVAARVDPRQLRQLLWNLILNASQAMADGGRLRVQAGPLPPEPQGEKAAGRNEDEKDEVWVEIAISDTGMGIPPEALERIFDPFFTTRRGGSGLGLATVHRVVEGNGGSVRVESRVGKGTTFRIRFPAAEDGQ